MTVPPNAPSQEQQREPVRRSWPLRPIAVITVVLAVALLVALVVALVSWHTPGMTPLDVPDRPSA